MKCPKCGKEAELNDEIVFNLNSVEGGVRRWSYRVTFQVYIHFGCSEVETPNFVFYVEKERGE